MRAHNSNRWKQHSTTHFELIWWNRIFSNMHPAHILLISENKCTSRHEHPAHIGKYSIMWQRWYVTALVGRTLARRLAEREDPNCTPYFPGSHTLKGFLNYASFADSKNFHGNDKWKFCMSTIEFSTQSANQIECAKVVNWATRTGE